MHHMLNKEFNTEHGTPAERRNNGTLPEQPKHRGTAEHYDRALPKYRNTETTPMKKKIGERGRHNHLYLFIK